jgi:hypothetical protein
MSLDNAPDLAHGGDCGVEVQAVDQAGNGVRINTRPLLGALQCPSPLPLMALLQLRVTTVRHLPSVLQGDVSSALGAAIARYCSSATDEHLFAVLGFPKLVLRAQASKGRKGHETQILGIAKRFMAGDLLSLWTDLQSQDDRSGAPETRSRKRARVELDEGAIPAPLAQRMRQLVGEGATRKALDLLLSTGTHDPEDPEVIARLRALHPTAPVPPMTSRPATLDPQLGDEAEGFWELLVQDSISRFPRASAPGPSGLRPSHLQDATKRRGRGLTLISALAKLTKLRVHGDLPHAHAPFLCGANLTPLRKTDGGVRPVAVGETLRRMVGKVLLATPTVRKQVATLSPTQCGVGVKGAAESVQLVPKPWSTV